MFIRNGRGALVQTELSKPARQVNTLPLSNVTWENESCHSTHFVSRNKVKSRIYKKSINLRKNEQVYKQVNKTYTSKYNYKKHVVISTMNLKVKYSNNPN